MLTKELSVTNFRLLGTRSFSFEQGTTVIFGSNATGKTSLLEAIGYCLRAKSLIGAKDYEIPTFGGNCFLLEAKLEGEKSVGVKISWEGRKSVQINGKPVRSSRELVENFKMVSITPATSLIATGTPSARREFLDDTASQINPSWSATISEYRSTLTERNAWLKSENGDRSLFEVLTESLIKTGIEVRKIRNEVSEMISRYIEVEDIEFTCTQKGELTRKEFAKVYSQEKAREQTVIGPHKDEWTLNLKSHQVDRFASTGEARRVTLSLKLAQANLITEKTGVEPIILADDLFAELDSERAQTALRQMQSFKQAFITCAQKPPQGDYTLLESDTWANQNQ